MKHLVPPAGFSVRAFACGVRAGDAGEVCMSVCESQLGFARGVIASRGAALHTHTLLPTHTHSPPRREPKPYTPSIMNLRAAAGTAPIPSLYNTPPVFPVYLHGLWMRHLVAGGGLAAVEARAKARAALVYGG